MKAKCRNSRYQPLLLVYTNACGLPVDVINAPKKIEVVSKETLLAEPPKSPIRHKHKERHNPNRHHHRKSRTSRTSNSLDPNSPAKLNMSSTSSGASMSPKSPRKHTDSPRSSKTNSPRSSKTNSPRNARKHSPNLPNKFQYSNQYNMERLNGVNDLKVPLSGGDERNLPFNGTHTIQESSSDYSIKNMTKNTLDKQDGQARKRSGSGSFKKKLGNVMKTMNPMLQFKQNKVTLKHNSDYVIPTSKSLDSIDFADVGYKSPYQSKSNLIQDKSASLPTQHDKLEYHQKMLNTSLTDLQQNGDIDNRLNRVKQNGLDTSFGSRESDDQLDIRNEEDLIRFNSRPEVVTLPNTTNSSLYHPQSQVYEQALTGNYN